MIGLIIFDLDDTLIDTSGSYIPFKLKLALKAMVHAGLQVDSVENAFDRLIELNAFAGNGKEAIKQFLEEFGWDENIFKIGIDKYYSEIEEKINIKSLPNTLNVLEELKQEQILVLVSYGKEREQYKKLYSAEIKEDWFKEIIIVDKYDKTSYYQQILTQFSITPEKVLVIGDKFKGDLLPAKNLGIKTVHFMHGRGKINPPALESVDYQIDNILKVKEIIKELR